MPTSQKENETRKYCKGMAVAMLNGDNDKNANAWLVSDSAAKRK